MDGRLTHPLRDFLPKGISNLLFKEGGAYEKSLPETEPIRFSMPYTSKEEQNLLIIEEDVATRAKRLLCLMELEKAERELVEAACRFKLSKHH